MARCFGDGDDLYATYHDEEWGRPPPDFGTHESGLFERLSLEVFQVGLSWLLIPRRREAFRQAFADFDPYQVAGFSRERAEELVHNQGIIRNQRKIEATIHNAQRVVDMHQQGETLAALFARHRPDQVITRRGTYQDLPRFTPQAQDLARELKSLGFRFVGPTNVYAMMQAMGLVDDHLVTCPVSEALGTEAQREADIWDEVIDPTPPLA